MAMSMALAVAASARAQSDPPHRSVRIGGYLQTQYDREGTDDGPAVDEVFFRRMVLTVRGQATPQWLATFQVDAASAVRGDRLTVKDAHLQYTGFGEHGITLTLGNQKMPFSRSLLTSSSRRSLVERPFTGDKAYGAPGRAIGMKVDGWSRGRTRYWSAAVASALHAPEADEIRVDGLPEASESWNQGVLAAGRVEWHPRGETPREQGAFDSGPARVVVGAGAFMWRNDGDRNPHTEAGRATFDLLADSDRVAGLELSAGLRVRLLSLDTEYSVTGARTVEGGFDGGLYVDGASRVHKGSVEAGVMLRGRIIEAAGAYDVLDTEVFGAAWRRAAAGLNWYLDGHNLRFQFMHRLSFNDRGSRGARAHATHVQAQIAF